jgi:hypothetical protein
VSRRKSYLILTMVPSPLDVRCDDIRLCRPRKQDLDGCEGSDTSGEGRRGASVKTSSLASWLQALELQDVPSYVSKMSAR